MCENLTKSISDSIYKKESFLDVKDLDIYFKVLNENKKTGMGYNKYALPVYSEFLDHMFNDEKHINEMECGFVIMDRCIYEEFHIFIKGSLESGKLTRPHNSGGVRYFGEEV